MLTRLYQNYIHEDSESKDRGVYSRNAYICC